MVVLWVALGPVPVTVTEYVPTGVVDPTVMFMVELLPELIGFGLKLAVVSFGRPLAESTTLCDCPCVMVVPMVEAPLWPWMMVRLAGSALIEKSSGGGGPPHVGYLKETIRVCQLNDPLLGMYS